MHFVCFNVLTQVLLRIVNESCADVCVSASEYPYIISRIIVHLCACVCTLANDYESALLDHGTRQEIVTLEYFCSICVCVAALSNLVLYVGLGLRERAVNF